MKEENNKSITYNEFYANVKKIIKKKNELEIIEKAYNFAKEKHKGKKRLNGEDYITHPLEVANIVTTLNVDYQTICSALLHETINHTDTDLSEIKNEFGDEIAAIVLSISKINKLNMPDTKDQSAQYLRKVLVGLSEDVRVLFIKLADRLHNMRTIDALPKQDGIMKAIETQNVLIPIAHRLGINSIKSELEDICLRYTKPEIYKDIEDHLQASREELNQELKNMENSISNLLKENNIKFKIKSRVKSIHSIYKKMDKGKSWNSIYDILALRVFVNTEEDCYQVLALIHSKYHPIAKRLKDYIANPKENMYQSLHTTITGHNGYPYEIQIRTYEMDEIAEKGIASHWSYKEKGSVKIQNLMEQKLEMYRNIIDANHNTEDETFQNLMKTEILNDRIYCYTPKGDLVELPEGSTPIDFAYRIHSNVGNTTIGCLVNNQIVPLDHKLEDRDIVKINTSKDSVPRKDWLNFVKTTQAKNKIKAFFNKQEKIEYTEKGKELLEKEIKRKKLVLNELLSQENINKLKQEIHIIDLEDIYFQIGSLRYTPTYIINLISEDKKDALDIYLEKSSNQKINNNNKTGIIVKGIDNILITIANCCKPVKGDPIIGYITKGKGILVHKKECPNIKESKRLIDVEWSNNDNTSYYTDIQIKTIKSSNTLLDIITIASQKDVYISQINTIESTDFIKYEVTVKTNNTEELNNFISVLKSLKNVIEVERKQG